MVGLEPSCTAVFRSDAAELFPDDQDVLRLRDHTKTLAELLTEHTPGYQPPSVRRTRAGPGALPPARRHGLGRRRRSCSSAAGAEAEHLETGCCGLAGNFGFQAGHGEVSRAIAERALLPKLRAANPGAVILADGFSCRTQIHELDSGGREAMHLAELLATAGNLGYDRPEQAAAPRPALPGATKRTAAVLAATAVLTTAAAGALLRRRLTRRSRA